ncbi:MAG: helix-turn-helix protein [Bacteroidetes bacterium]|nr:helix-turn-helix protein [Bacteroidota bacterium]
MTDQEYIKKVGLNIKRIRVEHKISQVMLAHACDFEKPNMQRIEAGKTNPTLKTLFKIAQALDVSVNDLLTF